MVDGCGCTIKSADRGFGRTSKSERQKFRCSLRRTDAHTRDFDSREQHAIFKTPVTVPVHSLNSMTGLLLIRTESVFCLLTLYYLLRSLCPSSPSNTLHVLAMLQSFSLEYRIISCNQRVTGFMILRSFPLSRFLTGPSLQRAYFPFFARSRLA